MQNLRLQAVRTVLHTGKYLSYSFAIFCGVLIRLSAGPVPGNGTTSDYLDLDNQLSQSAQTAATPSGYMSVFNNLQSSNFQPFSYMTYSILPGNQYDVAACATNCNRTTGCSAFNIYYERQPMYQITDDCPDPPPVTNIMCALYSQPISAADATNQGQTYVSRDGENFAIVIAGSNGMYFLSACSFHYSRDDRI